MRMITGLENKPYMETLLEVSLFHLRKNNKGDLSTGGKYVNREQKFGNRRPLYSSMQK